MHMRSCVGITGLASSLLSLLLFRCGTALNLEILS